MAAVRQKWVSPGMVIQMADGEPDSLRVGYTASKKVGNAVARNRAKRRLREVVRSVMPASGVVGQDYVIIARAAATDLPYAKLLGDMKWSLKRLKGQKS